MQRYMVWIILRSRAMGRVVPETGAGSMDKEEENLVMNATFRDV